MGRPCAKGFPFFPLDSDIFYSDKRLKRVKVHHGTGGILLYLFILCEAYRVEGYYVKYNNDFLDDAADFLNVSANEIGLILNFFFERSLLDGKLFKTDKVLTSHGIQKRFQEMSKGRGAKHKILVDSNLWLLNEEETESFISFTQNLGFSQKNSSNSVKNNSSSVKNPTKRKERKIKENKTKESKAEDTLSAAIIEAYESNIGTISPMIYNKLFEWQKDVDESLILYAIEQAVEYNRKSWAYINTILNNHHSCGRITRADAKAVKPPEVKSKPKNSFHNFEQRDIDIQQLEDEILDSSFDDRSEEEIMASIEKMMNRGEDDEQS